MASKEDYLKAAKTRPSDRTPQQEALVKDAERSGMTDITNAAHAAEKDERYNW